IEGADEAWWTMGFEAFGTIEKLRETLINVCNISLENCPLVLADDNCYSYPAWLKNTSDF
ncbi:MAG: hypothetical protein V2I47_05925, partial [Bacteroidales bacterium]|nr:hypothetical protein [Bacteroidales bacterium]